MKPKELIIQYLEWEIKDWTQNFQLIYQFTLHSNTQNVHKVLFPAHSFAHWPREYFRQNFPFLAGRGVQCILWGSLPDFLRERTYAQVPRELCSHAHSCMTGKRKLPTSLKKNNQRLQKYSGVSSGSVPGESLLWKITRLSSPGSDSTLRH